jgi:uncharacterized protein (UPF0216 family)
MSREMNQEERLLKKQILILNRHIPRRRKSLQDLLQEEKPHIIGSDGVRHRFKKIELELISEIIPKDDWSRLKLPLYIEIDSETSGARIAGRIENKVVCKILGKEGCSDELFIYRPDIKKLRKELPTTSQYIFLTR